jgi:hypothetical protein
MTKHQFEPIAPARRGAALLGAIGAALDQLPPATVQPAPVEAAFQSALPRPEAFVLRLSPDVFRQIEAEASKTGVTMTAIIAQALTTAGFAVPAQDLRDRRKRRHRTL